MSLYRSTLIASFVCIAVISSQSTLRGETLFGVTDSNQLLVIDSVSRQITSTTSLSGLGGGETMIGIDIRPATGELYGYSSADQFYKINPATGGTSPLGSPLGLIDTNQAFDFDPVTDQIRLVTSFRKNIRINPNNGSVISNDALLTYSAGDPNAGVAPTVVQAAHNNNFPGATTTTLFDLEAARDVLTTQTPENDGLLQTVGPLGLPLGTLSSFNGMDISGLTGIAYVVGTSFLGNGLIGNTLYTVNLGTGQISESGPIQDLSPAPLTSGWHDPHDPWKKKHPSVIVDVAAQVPEPSTFVLAGCGALALVAVARRRYGRRS